MWMPLRLQLNLHLLAEAEVAAVAEAAAGEIPRHRKHLSLRGNAAARAKQTTHNKTKALIISYEILMDSQSDMQLAKPESGAAAAA